MTHSIWYRHLFCVRRFLVDTSSKPNDQFAKGLDLGLISIDPKASFGESAPVNDGVPIWIQTGWKVILSRRSAKSDIPLPELDAPGVRAEALATYATTGEWIEKRSDLHINLHRNY